MKIVFIGAGNIGSVCAMLCLENNLGEVVLIDKNKKLAVGKALDLSQAYEKQVIGTNEWRALKGAKVVVVSAGFRRLKGQTRQDLYSKNSRVIKHVCKKIKIYSPNPLVIMVTNPVDDMGEIAKQMGIRVLILGNQLDTKRLKYFIKQEKPFDEVAYDTAFVTGKHNEEMLIGYFPTTLTVKQRCKICEQTIKGGQQFLPLIGTNASFAPAKCIVELIKERLK